MNLIAGLAPALQLVLAVAITGGITVGVAIIFKEPLQRFRAAHLEGDDPDAHLQIALGALLTSFAFIAGLLPLVVATGPGAVGNRTIGASSLGGMLFGTVIGVIAVPGLYYLFGKLAERRPLLREETDEPLSERVAHRG